MVKWKTQILNNENLKSAVIIGNSDGIGLGLTKRLLELDWQVEGISRSQTQIEHKNYNHSISQVEASDYIDCLKSSVKKSKKIDLSLFAIYRRVIKSYKAVK